MGRRARPKVAWPLDDCAARTTIVLDFVVSGNGSGKLRANATCYGVSNLRLSSYKDVSPVFVMKSVVGSAAMIEFGKALHSVERCTALDRVMRRVDNDLDRCHIIIRENGAHTFRTWDWESLGDRRLEIIAKHTSMPGSGLWKCTALGHQRKFRDRSRAVRRRWDTTRDHLGTGPEDIWAILGAAAEVSRA